MFKYLSGQQIFLRRLIYSAVSFMISAPNAIASFGISFSRIDLKSILIFSFLFSSSCSFLSKSHQNASPPPEELRYSPARLSKTMPFIEHSGPDVMQNYLAQNVSFEEVELIRKSLEKKIAKTLKNRGEAHVTLLSPIEYKKSNMAKKVGIKAISEFAQTLKIQNLKLIPICVGRGTIEKPGGPHSLPNLNNAPTGSASEGQGSNLETYFIVLDPSESVSLRQKIKDEFKLDNFDPKLFFPHITIGFTERDLHFEDGVRKDETSCFAKLISVDESSSSK